MQQNIKMMDRGIVRFDGAIILDEIAEPVQIDRECKVCLSIINSFHNGDEVECWLAAWCHVLYIGALDVSALS